MNDCEIDYYPRSKSNLRKLIDWLVGVILIFVCFSFLYVLGYINGVDYALLQLPETGITSHDNQPKLDKKETSKEIGIASWYDYHLDGIEWSKDHNTAASRSYPRYSYVKVTNPENGKSVIVYINDYGPTVETGREIDLSSHAFSQLAPLSAGLIKVQIELYEI